MTTPNPTPTTREREAAGITKIALKYFRDNWQLRWALEQDIAAALARERREALERACQCVCIACFAGIPVVQSHRGLVHEMSWGMQHCDAAAIRAEMDKP